MLEMFDLIDCENGRYSGQKLSFQHLLVLAQNFQKTEPKDGIFATLGMLSEEICSLRPDYTKSLGSIMQDATRHVLSQNNNLGLLRFVNHRSDLEVGKMPSWVRRADWQYSTETDPRPLKDLFCAANGLAAPSKLRRKPQDPSTLVIEGLLVDRVSAMTPLCALSTFQDLRKFEAWLLDGLRIIKKATANDLPRSRLIAIASAITAERASSGARATRSGLEAAARYLECLLETDYLLEAFCETYTRERLEAHGAMRQLCELGDVRNRRLFVTATNKPGLGPFVMQEGDVVAILRGLSYPCLLRPLGQDYQFMGVAYVYGIMDGEAVLDYRGKCGEEVVFNLR